MYNVHMTRFTASEARRELFRILDSVERGQEVVLERRGTRFRIVLDSHRGTGQETSRRLKIKDPVVLSGEWTWISNEDGDLDFQERDPTR